MNRVLDSLLSQNIDLHSLAAYQYDLPKELIAQKPSDRRGESRLLIVDRKSGSLVSTDFSEIRSYFSSGDHLVLNDTKVIRARLRGVRQTGGAAEIFLSKPLGANRWEALAKPLKKLLPGSRVTFSSDFFCRVLQELPEGLVEVEFYYHGNFFDRLEQYGDVPLPPYIEREVQHAFDGERYQTVFAEKMGAVAAPTAGLHFTREMLDQLKQDGLGMSRVTLHVGLGTFRPVQVEDIRDHAMHREWLEVTPRAAKELNAISGRCISIGTTACRTLETCATKEGLVEAKQGETNLFIYPGYAFKKVDALLTNFHLPGSTLLMLVSAFAGYDLIREAYQKAIEERFRFFSYGDAMLIV